MKITALSWVLLVYSIGNPSGGRSITTIENLDKAACDAAVLQIAAIPFREIAAILGVTESRVCQLHSQAVARLRSKLKDW